MSKQDNALAAIILAAGKGVRMQSELPKVLHAVCATAMVDYVLRCAQECGAQPVVVVVGTGAEAVKEHLKRHPLLWATQEQQLGTADAVKAAQSSLKKFDGWILILNGDAPLISAATVRRLLEGARAAKADLAVLTGELANPSGYGRIVKKAGGKLKAIVEEKDCSNGQRGIREINVGVYAVRSKALWSALKRIGNKNKQGEYYLTDLVSVLRKEGRRMTAVETADPLELAALGVNSRADLAQAQRAMSQRIMREKMSAGVTIVDPSNTYIEDGVEIGKDTVVMPFTVIRKGVRIGRGCEVGPFAHLRGETVLEDGAEIGNFCEVKKSVIGEHTKAKHLSYLGDAVIGKHVNIGAGTITANYDGKHKHRTEIGDGAHIGSNTTLVAPVRVGKNAVTGAGSVVVKNRDVEDGDTVAGVPARSLKIKNAGSNSSRD